jgi:23S rRNA pseudouridine2604 synthase
MSKGVPILGVHTKKCKVLQESSHVFRITLIQGLNRQIRRMCEHFGYEVTKLERVRIMNIGLKGLPLGEWRDLSDAEMDALYQLLEDSTNDDVRKSSKPTPAKKTKNKFGIYCSKIQKTIFEQSFIWTSTKKERTSWRSD